MRTVATVISHSGFCYFLDTMTRADVENLTIAEEDLRDIATGKVMKFRVNGLPPHLHAEITGGQMGYSFSLVRTGDMSQYEQQKCSGSPEAALEALKRLLTWEA